jgi:hypothetical protein
LLKNKPKPVDLEQRREWKKQLRKLKPTRKNLRKKRKLTLKSLPKWQKSKDLPSRKHKKLIN